MTDSPSPDSLTPSQLFALARRRKSWLIAPALLGALLAGASTLVVPRDWKATQGLVIRSDAAGYADQRLGKFSDLSEMKTLQETLLELARSRSVVSGALRAVTPRQDEPNAKLVERLREKLRFAPPGGAEFGKTEVFYLGVLDPDRRRAIGLVEAMTDQLDNRLRELRNQQAASLVAEVERSVDTAKSLLAKNNQQLSEFEQRIGSDLYELRSLTTSNGGQSEIALRGLAIEEQSRRLIDARRRNEALAEQLRAAERDPRRLLATPNSLLTDQPGLRRLKEGLVESQLEAARLSGARTGLHPYVVAARKSQQAVNGELRRELPAAIAGVELDIEVARQRESELAEKSRQLRERAARLASQRTEYAELVATVEGQTRVLEGALKQLADAKAHQAGATATSLLERIDGVETGIRPVGPSRKTVTAAGGLAGLMLGASLLLLAGPAPANQVGRSGIDDPWSEPKRDVFASQFVQQSGEAPVWPEAVSSPGAPAQDA